MLLKNCNAFDFTHKHFKLLRAITLGVGGPLKWETCAFAHSAHS